MAGPRGSGARARGEGRGRRPRAAAGLTHRHVGARSDKGIGHGIYELAAHAKVTELDLPATVHQDVGWLDVCAGRTDVQTHMRRVHTRAHPQTDTRSHARTP